MILRTGCQKSTGSTCKNKRAADSFPRDGVLCLIQRGMAHVCMLGYSPLYSVMQLTPHGNFNNVGLVRFTPGICTHSSPSEHTDVPNMMEAEAGQSRRQEQRSGCVKKNRQRAHDSTMSARSGPSARCHQAEPCTPLLPVPDLMRNDLQQPGSFGLEPEVS